MLPESSPDFLFPAGRPFSREVLLGGDKWRACVMLAVSHLTDRRRPARLRSAASGSPPRTPLQGGKETCEQRGHVQPTRAPRQICTLVGQRRRSVHERWRSVHERLEGRALGLADQSFDQRLDVVHVVLHRRQQHLPQEARVEERPRPARAHAHTLESSQKHAVTTGWRSAPWFTIAVPAAAPSSQAGFRDTCRVACLQEQQSLLQPDAAAISSWSKDATVNSS